MRRAGRDRRHSEGKRQGDLGESGACDVRRRAHRRDRARHQARRHRVPDPPCGIHRPQLALRASGHDQFGRARHLPRRAVEARERHSDRRCRGAARGDQATRARIQIHAGHRPFAWHPRRADDVRAETGAGLRRVFARPCAAHRGARGNRHLRDFGRGRHLRQYRSARGSSMSRKSSASPSNPSRRR